MGFYDGLGGLLEVELMSADMESTFDAIMAEGVGLYSVRPKDQLTSVFVIRRSELPRLRHLTSRRGEELSVCEKRGLYWKLHRLLGRPVLTVGALIMILLTVLLPTRILFLRVDGDPSVPSRRILEAAQESGIYFGANREAVRSEKIKNRLLALVPELEWAGINTRGCVAYISIRERSPQSSEAPRAPSSIVAERDGIISSITVSSGTPRCAVGEAVLEGQLLISGYTDCGIALLSGTAKGEVYAYTSRQIGAVSPKNCSLKGSEAKTERRYSIIFGKKRINFWKGSGICPSTCGRMYERYYITLPGGFTLPVCIVRETVTWYDLSPGETSDEGQFLTDYAERYLLSAMTAGKILDQDTELMVTEELLILEGSYGCLEMIGRSKREEIGEGYG